MFLLTKSEFLQSAHLHGNFFFLVYRQKSDPYFFNGPRGHVSGKKKAYFNLLLKYFRKANQKRKQKKNHHRSDRPVMKAIKKNKKKDCLLAMNGDDKKTMKLCKKCRNRFPLGDFRVCI